MIRRLRLWWKHLRRPPVVVISYSDRATDRRQVHVSVSGVRGSLVLFICDATPDGEACASLVGTGLAEIVRCRLVDQRGLPAGSQKQR